MRGRSWAAFALGAGLVVGAASPGRGQGLLPPAPGGDLERLSRRMAEAVRDLAEDIVANLGQTPSGQYLARDAQELERSTGEWYGQLRGSGDPYQVRRSYSGIDAAWHRLRGQLGSPGVANPGMGQEIARVEQADAQIHQALNLNAYPPNFDAAPAAPTGLDETRRLAYSLAQRGEALASIMQQDYANSPNGENLINSAADVARTVDAFYDGMNNPAAAQQPDYARLTFSQIVEKSNNLGIAMGAAGLPPRVNSAWQSYVAIHNLLRLNLGLTAATPNGLPAQQPQFQPQPGLNVPPPVLNGYAGGIPYVPNQTAPVGQWAQELDRQVDELVANFAPTVQVVPEGREMFEEMQRLRNDVHNFQGDAAQGLDPSRLAYEFREVDADWQRLARRFNRVARGRTGPNIQRVQQIGQTCEQIHRVLGMPGYPPVIAPFDDTR